MRQKKFPCDLGAQNEQQNPVFKKHHILKIEDIAAFRVLTEREYKNITDKTEIFRKAHFLQHFAKEMPTIIDKEEWVIIINLKKQVQPV